MSFFDSASLVQIPSGVKDGVLYSVKPIDGSGDLTFSRGSDIEATRVNANGYIEKAQVNLLLQSNSFTTASWDISSVTFTSGQAGYDGTNDAWKLQSNVTNANIFQIISTSGVSTFSVYAKAGNVNWVRLRYDNTSTTDVNLWVNLSDGSKGTDNGIASYTENIGNGWWRVVVQTNTSDLNNLRVYPANGDGTNADTGEYIYIQDAQLNYGLVAQTYQETTTAAVVSGITDNMPRLSYDPANPTCPSLLLEPSRTNLINHSEWFGAWTSNAIVTTNTTISPTGYQDASTLEDNTTAYLDKRNNVSITANATYTYSVFVKKTTGSLTHYAGIGVLLTGVSGVVDYGIINTTTGAINRDASSNINSVSYSSVDYGDYWRIVTTFTDNQSNTLCTLILYPAISTNGTSISSSAQGSNVFYGAQLELGSYSSSLIPTYGASATRTADACNKTGISSLIGQTEGTLFVEVTDWQLALDTLLFSVSDGTLSNYIQISTNASTGDLQSVIFAGGGATPLGNTAPTAGQTVKIAVGYKVNDYALYVNGVQIGTLTSKAAPSALTRTDIGSLSWLSTGLQPRPKFAQALLFKTRLSNADLATLTSL